MARAVPVLTLTLLASAGCPPGHWFPAGETDPTTDGSSTGDGGSTGAGSTSAGASGSTSEGTASGSGTSSTSTSTASTQPATTDSTTETPPDEFPLCGNGEIDGPEECDDGDEDPSDTCDHCRRERLAFVTSKRFDADAIISLDHADELCRQLAGAAELPNWKTYTAWISDSQTDARDRLYPGRGRYVRVDRVPIAATFDDLFSGALLAPINLDEYGATPMDSLDVWTGTRPDGTAVPGAEHCNDWTDGGFATMGYTGMLSEMDEWWTLIPNPETNPIPCVLDAHLYCFEGK